MELIHVTHKASKLEPQDFISNMPDNVMTNILDRLPLQDAVRTDALSKNWRFKWTMLTQLVFDDHFLEYLSKTKGKNNLLRIISRLLLHLRGPITKFVLYIDEDELDVEDINHWILFLSRKGIKDLTLMHMNETPFELPTHLYSCLELKHLKVYNSRVLPPPSVHGFPNLLSLELYPQFEISNDVGEFATRCPLLEILKLEYFLEAGKVNLLEIAKLNNLKILSLTLCQYDNNILIISCGTIFELLGSLPKLQELHLDFKDCVLAECDAKKRFSTAFTCVKALELSICLDNEIKLSSAFELIRSFPNMQTLEISTQRGWYDVSEPEISSTEVEYNTMELLQLQSVVFTYFSASENEVCLIKYLLACSPFLKKIVIRPDSCLASGKRSKFCTKLLKLYRASPLAELSFL